MIGRLITDERARVRCPVCGNWLQYLMLDACTDVSERTVLNHSEGLVGSGRACAAVGLLGYEAMQLGADVGRDPQLPLRAHP